MAAQWRCWVRLGHKWEPFLGARKGEGVLLRCKRCGKEQGPGLVDYTGGA